MTKPIKLPPFTGRLSTSPEQHLISEYARLAVEQNTAEHRAEVEKLREAAKQALEALDSDNPDIQLRAATALRNALKEPK
jgi:uncharacterized protein (UPF0147 family)